MKKISFVVFCVLFTMLSCQSDKSSDSAEKPEVKRSNTPVELATPPPPTNPDGTKRKAWAILTVDMWHYNFALKVSDTPKENIYEGYWIDFEDDFTYTKGHYGDLVASGIYDFNFDTKILEILPTSGEDEPSQWEVMTNGEVIILIGTAKYGNNATQIKLVREREKPVKR